MEKNENPTKESALYHKSPDSWAKIILENIYDAMQPEEFPVPTEDTVSTYEEMYGGDADWTETDKEMAEFERRVLTKQKQGDAEHLAALKEEYRDHLAKKVAELYPMPLEQAHQIVDQSTLSRLLDTESEGWVKWQMLDPIAYTADEIYCESIGQPHISEEDKEKYKDYLTEDLVERYHLDPAWTRKAIEDTSVAYMLRTGQDAVWMFHQAYDTVVDELFEELRATLNRKVRKDAEEKNNVSEACPVCREIPSTHIFRREDGEIWRTSVCCSCGFVAVGVIYE